jgi:two-component system OmpR family response regulator
MPADGPGAERLLVVEDDQTILELLSGSLRFAGFDVVTAASGAEALAAVTASRPDLVLLDVMMPDGDGFEVVRRAPGHRHPAARGRPGTRRRKP